VTANNREETGITVYLHGTITCHSIHHTTHTRVFAGWISIRKNLDTLCNCARVQKCAKCYWPRACTVIKVNRNVIHRAHSSTLYPVHLTCYTLGKALKKLTLLMRPQLFHCTIMPQICCQSVEHIVFCRLYARPTGYVFGVLSVTSFRQFDVVGSEKRHGTPKSCYFMQNKEYKSFSFLS